MNSYSKYIPNVYLAKCPEMHEKGEIIELQTKYGKTNEHVVFNLIYEKDGFFYYSIVRADGFNTQEWAKRKAERYSGFANTAVAKGDAFYNKSNKDRDFLSLGEPIKIGHHSEGRHRRIIEQAHNNFGKYMEQSKKAESYESKAEYWESKASTINLSMPESLEYFEFKLERAKKIHEAYKTGKVERTHSFSLSYAKKDVNEASKQLEFAKKLWA